MLAPNVLLGRGLLVITKTKLLTTLEPSQHMRLQDYFAWIGWILQGLPNQ